MQEVVERAKAEFTQAIGGLKHALATTPNDRIQWSPSPTARSPLQVAAHAAIAIGDMLGNLNGNTFPIPTTEEAERFHRERDSKFSTCEAVLQLLDQNQAAYFEWLDNLTPSMLNSFMNLPFGMGSMPTQVGIDVMSLHVNWHTAQINYIQTIYGDHDWHL